MIETREVKNLVMKIKQGLCFGSELLPEECPGILHCETLYNKSPPHGLAYGKWDMRGKCSNCEKIEKIAAEWWKRENH
ncbi:hypothetical protein LCGC14_0812880 [marine sediment metagenome]|uniref:Uncharacterized protein n=1 Tax=marine sediment metagenome TaxID=412755 RepID=A0A0F9STH5_9ZZZZ